MFFEKTCIFVFIIYMTSFRLVQLTQSTEYRKCMDDIVLRKRTSSGEQRGQSNNVQQTDRIREKRIMTEEQRQIQYASDKMYKASLTKKGLEEARKKLSPESYEKLKSTAERRKRLQKEYNELSKERRKSRFARGKESLKDIEAVQKANKRCEQRKIDSILHCRRTNIVSDEQQNLNNVAQQPSDQINKKKRVVKKTLTEEQKEIKKERVREYKLSQSWKGLKEARKYMTPEAVSIRKKWQRLIHQTDNLNQITQYAKLEKSASRRRQMGKIYQRRYRERKEEERKSAFTPLKLDLALQQQSESQKLDIERANRAALFQLSSSSPPFKQNVYKHKDTQAQHQNQMQEGPSQP